MKGSKAFLKNYVKSPSPVGYEMILGGQKTWIEYVKQYADRVETDAYGNAYAWKHADLPEGIVASPKTVLLDAHCDEIGFFVFDITPDGYIKVGRLGGADIFTTPAARVNIWGENGVVSGVFGHPAIHVHQNKPNIEISSIFIDIGVSSREDVEKKGVIIGSPITMTDGYMELGDYHCGRSLDDKIGGFINAQLLRTLHEEEIKLPFDLVIVNAVQEEVGLHGAQMAAMGIKPDVAIAIDVCHDTESPAYNKAKEGSYSAGKGVVIGNGPCIQKNLYKLMVDTAKEKDIPYQIYPFGRSSGTNADSYAYPHGIPTGLLKLAMKYMHTTAEMVHKDDVEFAIDLLKEMLQKDGLIESLKYK